MYVREVDHKPLTFTAPSTVWRNDLVMKDRETKSLWSHHSMKAIDGPHKGAELAMYPYVLTTWGAWRRLHPDSLILDKTDTWVNGTRLNLWDTYYSNPSLTGQLGLGNPDKRLDGKTVMVAVRDGAVSTVYPHPELAKQPVVNDTVGKLDIVTVFDVKSRSAAVWRREVAGRVLEFETAPAQADATCVRDRQTGTVWRALDGKGLRGPLKSHALTQVPSVTGYWFAWATHYPEARVWQADPPAK